MRFGTTCIAAAMLAIAQGGRYELVPELDVRQMSSNRVASAYVIDKTANEFWICTVRYSYQDLMANNGDCVKLPTDISRPFANRGLRCARGNRLRRCQRFSSCDLVHRDHKWRDSVLRHTPRGVMRADESAVTAETCPCQHRRFCQLLAFFELALTARSTNGVAI